MTTCPKCSNHSFELTDIEIRNARHSWQALVCTICGCLITIVPYRDTNSLIRTLAEKLHLRLD